MGELVITQAMLAQTATSAAPVVVELSGLAAAFIAIVDRTAQEIRDAGGEPMKGPAGKPEDGADGKGDGEASGDREPGKPDSSEVIRRVTTNDDDDLMPPEKVHKPVSKAEVELLRKWIAGGAVYAADSTKPPSAKNSSTTPSA